MTAEGGPAPTSNGHSEEVGHDVDLPAEVLLDPHTVLSDHYAQVTGARPLPWRPGSLTEQVTGVCALPLCRPQQFRLAPSDRLHTSGGRGLQGSTFDACRFLGSWSCLTRAR